MPAKKESISAAIAATPEKARLTISTSRPKARPRVSAPARSVGSLRGLRNVDLARHPLDAAVEPPRGVADRVADVLDEADALGADRGPQLGRLGDPLDQPLRLLAGQQPPPDLVDHLAVQRVDHGPLHRLALQRPVHGLLDQRPLQDPHQGALDRLAFDRRDHRLLGGGLDGPVDAGRPADRARSPHPGAEQPHRERQGLAGGPFAGRRILLRSVAVSHRASIRRGRRAAPG